MLAPLLRLNRFIAVCHSFLQSDLYINSVVYTIYEFFAVVFLRLFGLVITTSPQLADDLILLGCPPNILAILPCSLTSTQESKYLSIPPLKSALESPLKILFIGRLDSYKRVDLLFYTLNKIDTKWTLSVVGDGPNKAPLEKLATELFSSPAYGSENPVSFHGRSGQKYLV